MRWKGRQQSDNIEDRRGVPVAPLVGGGSLLVLGLALLTVFLGGDPKALLDAVGDGGLDPGQVSQSTQGQDDEAKEFIGVVLKDTENVWNQLFREYVEGAGGYKPPKLVIFARETNTACGRANAATGPFYCPLDETVYIDPAFFDEMRNRLKADGDFAQAYVIAHEVAHHVQKMLRLMEPVNRARASGNPAAANRASVRLELQADYLAGVWAHHAQKNYAILESGDIAEALNAANQIGDDTLQRMSQGFVVPERFTHGTSEQRVRWFREGLKTGDLNACQKLFEIRYEDL